MKSEAQLRRWYNKFNEQWFDNKLPKDTTLIWEAVSGGQAETIERIDPEGTFIIRMNPGIAWSKKNAQFVLLHEMAHISVWPYWAHGKPFQEEMLRLAQIGAFKTLW